MNFLRWLWTSIYDYLVASDPPLIYSEKIVYASNLKEVDEDYFFQQYENELYHMDYNLNSLHDSLVDHFSNRVRESLSPDVTCNAIVQAARQYHRTKKIGNKGTCLTKYHSSLHVAAALAFKWTYSDSRAVADLVRDILDCEGCLDFFFLELMFKDNFYVQDVRVCPWRIAEGKVSFKIAILDYFLRHSSNQHQTLFDSHRPLLPYPTRDPFPFSRYTPEPRRLSQILMRIFDDFLYWVNKNGGDEIPESLLVVLQFGGDSNPDKDYSGTLPTITNAVECLACRHWDLINRIYKNEIYRLAVGDERSIMEDYTHTYFHIAPTNVEIRMNVVDYLGKASDFLGFSDITNVEQNIAMDYSDSDRDQFLIKMNWFYLLECLQLLLCTNPHVPVSIRKSSVDSGNFVNPTAFVKQVQEFPFEYVLGLGRIYQPSQLRHLCRYGLASRL